MTTQKVCDVCGTVCSSTTESIAIVNSECTIPCYSASLPAVPVAISVSAVAGVDTAGNQRDICKKCAWTYLLNVVCPNDLTPPQQKAASAPAPAPGSSS